MTTIKKFPDSSEAMAKRRQNDAWQREKRQSNSKEDGRRAWDSIELWRQEKKERLEKSDRETIGRNLWSEFEKYKYEHKGKLGELFGKAGLEPKEKARLTLPPGKSGKDLRTEVAPYLQLIKALANQTGEDIELLADRVLFGTKFHPVSSSKLQETQLILDALQVAVDRIDQEFHLWEQCKTIEEIRKPREEPYEEALRSDGEADRVEEEKHPDASGAHLAGTPVEKWWPLEKFLLHYLQSEKLDNERKPVNAFWLKTYQYNDPWAAGVWSGESIFFFPHIYLGPAIDWPAGKLESCEEDSCWVGIRTDPEPFVKFDDGSQEYHVHLRDPKTEKVHHGGVEFDWDMSPAMSLAARWLIIYPDPEARRLIPAVFSRGEFIATGLLPLSARLIAEFDDLNRWQYVGRDGAPTLLQRLKVLTGFGAGDFKVKDAWRETAARFHLNPIFKSSNPSEIERIRYRLHLERWIKENRCSEDGDQDQD